MKKIIETERIDMILEKLATRPYNQVADIISDILLLVQQSKDYVEQKPEEK